MSDGITTSGDRTIINAKTIIKGELTFSGPATVYGRIEGQVRGEGALEIMAEGSVFGDIVGAIVDIQGMVKGNVSATQTMRLGPNGKLIGELRAANLAIAEGATFVGKVFVGVVQEEAKRAEMPRVEAPRVEVSRVEAPRVETPRLETPRAETPRIETPRVEGFRPASPLSEGGRSDASAFLQSRLAALRETMTDEDNEELGTVSTTVQNVLKRGPVLIRASH